MRKLKLTERELVKRQPQLFVNRQGYLDFGVPPKNLPKRPTAMNRRKPGEPIIPPV